MVNEDCYKCMGNLLEILDRVAITLVPIRGMEVAPTGINWAHSTKIVRDQMLLVGEIVEDIELTCECNMAGAANKVSLVDKKLAQIEDAWRRVPKIIPTNGRRESSYEARRGWQQTKRPKEDREYSNKVENLQFSLRWMIDALTHDIESCKDGI